MSVVKINAIEVPEGGGAELERRFGARARAVDQAPGFEGFDLLRPVAGESRYFVYSKWASEEAFQDWMKSEAFAHGHAGPSGDAPRVPIATNSELLSFEVVDLS